MAASFLSSFLIFILTGCYALFRGLNFAQDTDIKLFVSLALLSNAILYHYIAAYTEMDEQIRSVLARASRLEWWVRVLNQCLLLSLWFALERGWTQFGITLVLLYFSFLLWDYLTWSYISGHHKVFWLDLTGMILSIVYVILGYFALGIIDLDANYNKKFYFFFGIISFAYLALPVIGMFLLRFNPFKIDYWTRPKLH